MRIIYMVGGFSSSDIIILNKFVQYGLDANLVYTRHISADGQVPKKVKTHWINLNRFNYLPKPMRWLIFGYETVSLLRKIRPDVILTQGIQAHGLLSVVSQVRPILLMPWGSDWAIVAQKNRIMRLLSRYVINRVNLIQIDCETGKHAILQLSRGKVKPEDIWVFPQGIELDIFKPMPEVRKILRQELGWIDKKVLIMTRQLKPVYGVDIFLKALSIIAQEHQSVRAIIVGDGPLEQDLKNLSLSLGLGDFVRFIGRVTRRDLVRYLNAADIYVSTSYSDGTSLCLLEAMAVGLPVVVTDVPANLEWVEDGYNGFIAKRGSPENVGEALLKTLDYPDLWRVFGGRNVKMTKEKADWDKNFKKFLSMFKLLQRKKKICSVNTSSLPV